MKAAVISQAQPGKVEFRQQAVRALASGEALVNVECCGVCHTDLHVVQGDFGPVPGRIPGHEGIGIVSAIADDVTSLKVGDRVSIAWFYECQRAGDLLPRREKCRLQRRWRDGRTVHRQSGLRGKGPGRS